MTVLNGDMRWADTFCVSTEAGRAGALSSIAASTTLPPKVINGALLEFVTIGEDALRKAIVPHAWTTPVPLETGTALPSFPIACLPLWLRAMSEELAEALQVPVDLPAMLSLAVLSTALAKKVTVCIRQGYYVPLNSYVMIGMESGERKSPTYRAMLAPLVKYERELIAAAKSDNEARDMAKEAPVPVPQLFADDITTEQVPVVLEQNGERLAILSDEADGLDIMAGKYSKGVPNFGIYLKGWDGGHLKVNRGMRPSIYLHHPLLTLGLCVQPSVLRGLTDTPAFRGRGLLGRFWYSIPTSFMGTRKEVGEPVSLETERSYRDHMRSLLTISLPIKPDMISVGIEAHEAFVAFGAEIEPQLAPDGALRGIADWASKLAGSVARLAGLLHMSGPERDSEEISLRTMQQAILIGRYLLEHARGAFMAMASDPNLPHAKAILSWIQRKGVDRFSQREVCQQNRSRFEHPNVALPALDILVEHGFLHHVVSTERKVNGRPPSQVYEVYPEIDTQKTQNPPPPEENGDSNGYSKPTQNLVLSISKPPFIDPVPAWIDDAPMPDDPPEDMGGDRWAGN